MRGARSRRPELCEPDDPPMEIRMSGSPDVARELGVAPLPPFEPLEPEEDAPPPNRMERRTRRHRDRRLGLPPRGGPPRDDEPRAEQRRADHRRRRVRVELRVALAAFGEHALEALEGPH